MSIKLAQGFKITSASPIDTRLILTKAQMASMNDNLMPTKYLAICSDDNKIYIYDKSSTSTGDTGKFALFKSDDVINGYYLNDKFYTDSTYTVECVKSDKYIYIDNNSIGDLYTWNGTKYNRSVKNANDTIAGIMNLYQDSGQNTDGTMSQKAITDGVKSIQLKISSKDSECLELVLPWS